MKTPIALAWIAIAGIGMLTGCSNPVTKQQDDPIVTTLMGQPSSFAEQKLGLPNRRNETKSGAEIWEYLDKQKGMAAKDCSVTLSIRNDVIENVIVNSNGQSLLSLASSSCKRIRSSLASEY
ncbi:hypothetical protein FT643_06470 [Ketobacter sp. MCCC 1A13808]|uniref:hypothetical protein n=1 Tax=Ketobacter sp. MCCC 1A13808 TaxID=2602738 RepID=UPI000F2CF675|nr:hypothetical protein [Ketobacter sp. MCCC 1A13808]MVF11787.1 hypothetical protein [Ketobacter sp. MCCC 1A13808]RLP55394.1 MAG: hypothetical protein D6160_06510 [Ketobacter sp.]